MKRILCIVALTLAASTAWGYQLRAFYNPPAGQPLTEAAGSQTVSVEVTREAGDLAAACALNVTVAAQDPASPFFEQASAGVDYTPTTVTLPFAFGAADTQLTQTFDVPVLDDTLVEITQLFAALVTNVSPGVCDPSVVLNVAPEDFVPIFDDDVGAVSLAVDQSTVVVDESAGSVAVGVTLSGTAAVEGGFVVVVDWNLVPGSAAFPGDFGTQSSGQLSFDESNVTQTLTVPIVDDLLFEPTEDFDLVLSNVVGSLSDESPLQVALAASTATVRIADDDSPGEPVFASATFEVDEDAGSATVTLQRQGGSRGPLTAFYQTVDGSAVAGTDYQATSGSIAWVDGEVTDMTFSVPILDDAAAEGDETVLLRVGPDAAFSTFTESTLTIIENETISTTSFSATSVNVKESGGGVTLTLVRGGPTTGAVSVDFATVDGSAVAGEDYVAAAGTVSWADGDGADKSVAIDLIEDADIEDAEDFQVVLGNVTGPTRVGSSAAITVTIDASDASRDISDIPTLTPNQQQLADWFDATCPRFDAASGLTPDQQDLADICDGVRDIDNDDSSVEDTLDEINPEELLVTTFNALRLTALQHGNISQRLNVLRSGARGVDLAGFNLEINGEQVAGVAVQEMFDNLVGGGASADDATWGRWGGFLNGRLATGDKDATDNEAGFDFDLYAITAGVDYRFRPNVIGGLSLGYGAVDSDYDDNDGGLDIDSWNAAAYFTYFREERFYLDALATYGRNDYQSERHIVFGSGAGAVDRTALGDTDGTQFSLGVGTGWDFNRGGLVIGPHLGAYYFQVEVDAFNEVDGGGLNVAIDDQSSRSKTVNAGGHLSYAWLTGWGVLVPNAKLDWVHEFADNSDTVSFRFVNDPFVGDPADPSPAITLTSDRPDPNYLIWSLGVSAQFIYGLSGFVNYQAHSGYRGVTLGEWTAGARWEKTF